MIQTLTIKNLILKLNKRKTSLELTVLKFHWNQIFKQHPIEWQNSQTNPIRRTHTVSSALNMEINLLNICLELYFFE